MMETSEHDVKTDIADNWKYGTIQNQTSMDQNTATDVVQEVSSCFTSLLDSFLGATNNGIKILDKLDSLLKRIGLHHLADKMTNLFKELCHQIKTMKGNISHKERNQNSAGIQNVVQTVAVFIQMQLTLVTKASTSLSTLLDTSALGQKLSCYVNSANNTPVHTTESNSKDSFNHSKASKASTAITMPETARFLSSQSTNMIHSNSGLVPWNNDSIQSASQRNDAYTSLKDTQWNNEGFIKGKNDKDGSLVSDQEIKDVIDLLSGGKTSSPPPTLPKPTFTNTVINDGLKQENNLSSQPEFSQGHSVVKPKISHPENVSENREYFPPSSKLAPQAFAMNNSQLYPLKHYQQFAIPAPVLNNPLLPTQALLPTHQQTTNPSTNKTNTWPMRPDKESGIAVEEVVEHGDSNQDISSDPEFHQFLNSVKQRTRRGNHRNPWSEDGATWSPLMYERPETRQWSTAEDSSNCSDESSSNGEWIATKLIEQDASMEAKSTGTWPPKHPWGAVGRPTQRSPLPQPSVALLGNSVYMPGQPSHQSHTLPQAYPSPWNRY